MQSRVVNGRGRGRGIAEIVSPWVTRKEKQESQHDVLREKMLQMAADVTNDSSSEEDEIHDEEILSKTVKEYKKVNKDEERIDENQFLLDILQSGAVTCLVCIENVKRHDAIWSCSNCSCIMHLVCIQKWAHEGVGRRLLQTEGDINEVALNWHCPKCRHEYQNYECPTKYFCFCGKEVNPAFDPWIVPHSCGQRCLKPLRPKCGHECLLLCHPGPCPPCPKTVKTSCHCERSRPKIQRCSKKAWSCAVACGKQLECDSHTCEEPCHADECPPCSKSSKQRCLCGKKEVIRACAEKQWTCEQVCGAALECGHHLCEKECHSSSCGACPRSGDRTCPCGKSTSTLPCTEDVPPCEDTCLKEMSCGTHQCAKRCHYGPCESCIQVVKKTCRCGKRSKEIPCSQVLTCDFKCTRVRSCERHACKKKCCDGNCPPCEQVCNRTLNCRNHKCPATCHTGICYPCPLSKKVSCYCGNNWITVPCGKEKATRPPKCKQPCKIPPDCHHQKRKPHSCHFKRCPDCRFECGKGLPCGHQCMQPCHERLYDKTMEKENSMRASSRKPSPDHYVATPCPDCTFPVEKSCYGKHKNELLACSQLKPFSCKQACGRKLKCGNHTCERECHVVKDAPSDLEAGRNCRSCEELCLKPRPDGCEHDCKLPCHPGECPDCFVHLKLNCHCGTIKLYLKCHEYNESSKDEKDILLCCKGRCPKMLSCGHLCPKTCHSDECVESSQCVEKSMVRCRCGRRKKAFPCVETATGSVKLACDPRCEENLVKRKKEQVEREEELMAAQIKKDQEELAKFERKKQGRKRKPRSITEVEIEETFFSKHKLVVIATTMCIVIGGITIKLLS